MSDLAHAAAKEAVRVEVVSAASDDAPIDVAQLEKQRLRPTTFTGRLRQHLRRFWWLHLIIGSCMTILITMLLAYVMYPHMAQTQVNQATIRLTDVVLSNPTPTSMDMESTAILLNSSPFSPSFEGFNGSLYLMGADEPYMTGIVIPPFTGRNGTVMKLKQHVTLTPAQVAGLGNFSAGFLAANTSFQFRFVGDDHMRLGKLPRIHVHLDEVLTTPGLNNLHGVSINNLTIDLKGSVAELGHGVLTTGTVTIPNPSVFTLPLGNVSQSLYVTPSSGPAVLVGNSTLPNLTLRPGTHDYPLISSTDPAKFLELIALPEFRCGSLPVTVVEHGSQVNAQFIDYFSRAVQNTNVTLTLDIAPALQAAGLGYLLGFGCDSLTK